MRGGKVGDAIHLTMIIENRTNASVMDANHFYAIAGIIWINLSKE